MRRRDKVGKLKEIIFIKEEAKNVQVWARISKLGELELISFVF